MADSSCTPHGRLGAETPADIPTDTQRRRLGLALGWGLAGAWLGTGCASHSDMDEAYPPSADHRAAEDGRVPLFSTGSAKDGLPAGWRHYIIRRDRARTKYDTAVVDGRSVLHAVADNARSGLHAPVRIDPRETPWFNWSWRVDKVHEAATVSLDEAEDTPTRIVLGFDGDVSRLSFKDRLFFEQVELFTGNRLPYATLVYVWDGKLPEEAVHPYLRSGRIQYRVVESGASRAGQWLQYERNVVDDFKRMFGEAPPGLITSVGLLTDSDDLGNRAEAWYGDMGFNAQPGQARQAA